MAKIGLGRIWTQNMNTEETRHNILHGMLTIQPVGALRYVRDIDISI